MRCIPWALVFACGVFSCKEKPKETPAVVAPSCPTCVTADDKGFTPTSLHIPKGAPGSTVKVTFTRTTNATCATEVVFPDLKLQEALPLGKPVSLDIPSAEARTLTFQCGMGMYKSSLVIQ